MRSPKIEIWSRSPPGAPPVAGRGPGHELHEVHELAAVEGQGVDGRLRDARRDLGAASVHHRRLRHDVHRFLAAGGLEREVDARLGVDRHLDRLPDLKPRRTGCFRLHAVAARRKQGHAIVAGGDEVTLWPSAGSRPPRTATVAPASTAPLSSLMVPATEPVISTVSAEGAARVAATSTAMARRVTTGVFMGGKSSGLGRDQRGLISSSTGSESGAGKAPRGEPVGTALP